MAVTPLYIDDLVTKTTLSDEDLVIIGEGDNAKKMTIAQLKEELGINALNTKTAPLGAFTNLWTPGAYIEGMGLGVAIPKKSGDTSLTVTAARVFTAAGWHDTNVLNVSDRINTWWVDLNDEGFTDLVSGNSYLVELTGSIS